MAFLRVIIVALLLTASAEGIERRRPLYRRGSTTTTVTPLTNDSEGSESNFKHHGQDLFTASDSHTFTSSTDGSISGSFKSDRDKITSFSEYTFGNSKLSGSGTNDGIMDGSISDKAVSFNSFKNHKKASLLPTTNASNKDRKPSNGAYDFLNGDFVKSKVMVGNGKLLEPSSIVSQGIQTKTSSTISSRFPISHPPSTISNAVGKLAHLDDLTQYDVFSSLEHPSGKTKEVKHRTSPSTFSSVTGSSLVLGGKIKKVPFKNEEGGLGGHASKDKQNSKLSIDDDTFGSGSLTSISNTYPSLESFDNGNFGSSSRQQQKVSNPPRSKFNFAEPPPLVKSTINTLKQFGEGIIGNGHGAGRIPYELESKENFRFGTYFGKGQYEPEESFDSSSEAVLSKGKISGSVGVAEVGAVNIGNKFVTDFDVKNIKLVSDLDAFSNIGHNKGTLTKNTSPLYKHPQSTLHLQHHQQQQSLPHSVSYVHANTLGNTGSIDNPNPLDFRPKFKLQDVPNLYPADHLGAGIAAKGQIENFLKSEHTLKDESLVTQLLGDGSPSNQHHFHQFLKSQEDENLEKEALRQQIEYLKAQAAKRQVDHSNPNRPAIISNAQKFRPLRRIPSHVKLGVKAPYPLPRIPHYNDRPYSISFKL